MDYRDVLERAAWTAVQGFLSVFVVTDLASVEAALVAAAAAALSVAKTAVKSQVG